MVERGVAQLRGGQAKDAVETFRAALAARPDDLSTRFLLALALYRSNELAAARNELAKVLAASPKDGRALHLDALCLLKMGDLKNGAAGLERALAVAPSNGAAALTLATTYVSLGEIGKAQALIDGPLQGAPPAVRNLVRGMILNAAGRYREAEAALSQAIEADPKLPTAHNQLGYTRMLLGDYPAAIREFERELQIAPGDFGATANLAWILVQEREFERAEPLLVEALRQQPDKAGLQYMMGQVWLHKRDLARAASALERAVTLEPEFRAAHVLLARVYARQNRPGDVARHTAIVAKLTAAEQERNVQSGETYGGRTAPPSFTAGGPR
jgi:tetratricopeptide (TPR) repeat protein